MDYMTIKKWRKCKEEIPGLLRETIKELKSLDVDTKYDVRKLNVIKDGDIDWAILVHYMEKFADIKAGMDCTFALESFDEEIDDFIHEELRKNLPYVGFESETEFILTNDIKDTFFMAEDDDDFEFEISEDDDLLPSGFSIFED